MASETDKIIDREIDSAGAKFIGRALKLDEKSYENLISAGQLRPSIETWFVWLDKIFLFVATAFLLAGIVCFVSFNWAGLHKFSKFALLESGVILAIAMAWYKGIARQSGKVLLFSAAILVGLSLAVFGQIYQSGADPYGLFLFWLILITAWTVIGAQSGLYVLFIVLSDLSLIFYWNQMISPPTDGSVWISSLFGPIFRLFVDSGRSYLPLFVLALNVGFIVAHERLGQIALGLKGRSTIRVSACAGLIPIASGAVMVLFSNQWETSSFFLMIAFIITVAVGLWYFRFRNRDLFLTAAILMTFIVFTTSLLIKSTNFGQMGIFSFFFIGVAVLLQTSAAAYWLRVSNTVGDSKL